MQVKVCCDLEAGEADYKLPDKILIRSCANHACRAPLHEVTHTIYCPHSPQRESCIPCPCPSSPQLLRVTHDAYSAAEPQSPQASLLQLPPRRTIQDDTLALAGRAAATDLLRVGTVADHFEQERHAARAEDGQAQDPDHDEVALPELCWSRDTVGWPASVKGIGCQDTA